MKKLFQVSALATAVLLGACASTPGEPPAELVQARNAVRTAEVDPQVLSSAPLELKRATDALSRANTLHNKGESLAEVTSAANVAERQAQTAMEIARAKRAEDAIRSADTDRERVRADIQAAQAARAQSQAQAARAQASMAGARAASAEARANSAEVQAATAQANAADAQQQASLAQQQAQLAQQQAAALQQQLSQVQAQQTDRGMLVTLGDVLFEFNRAEVKPGASADISKVAEFLRQHPDRRIRIEGYTDAVGAAEYNKTLSLRRAEAVRAALVAQGVPADRIEAAGYGKDYPVADNTSDTNRALNRRVEVYISNNDQPVRARRG